MIERLRKDLRLDEGERHEIYLDHLGLPTAGIGHLILESDPEHGQPVGTKVSQERVDKWFAIDLNNCLQDCQNIFSGRHTEKRHGEKISCEKSCGEKSSDGHGGW